MDSNALLQNTFKFFVLNNNSDFISELNGRWLVLNYMTWNYSHFDYFCISATGFSFYKYYEVKNANVTEEFKLPEQFHFELDYVLSMERTWLIFGLFPLRLSLDMNHNP